VARGGKRQGAGRKRGALSKKTQEIAAKASAEGITPLEVMVGAMREAWERNDREAAARYAKDAAPYMHPRLAAVEHTGKDGKDLIPETVTPFELARYMAFVLEQASERKPNGHANGHAA
jgi:hypothetical protein